MGKKLELVWGIRMRKSIARAPEQALSRGTGDFSIGSLAQSLYIGIYPGEREGNPRLPSSGGDRPWLLFVFTVQPKHQFRVPPLFSVLRGVLVSFWGFPRPPRWLHSSHRQQQWGLEGCDREEWPPDLNRNGFLLDFRARLRLSITNTMFRHNLSICALGTLEVY